MISKNVSDYNNKRVVWLPAYNKGVSKVVSVKLSDALQNAVVN